MRVSSDHSWIDETSINFETNESDSYALEEGLQIREKNGDGEVVVISMGPEGRSQKVIREALPRELTGASTLRKKALRKQILSAPQVYLRKHYMRSSSTLFCLVFSPWI